MLIVVAIMGANEVGHKVTIPISLGSIRATIAPVLEGA
jgi:hypothetical protein